MVNYKSNSKNKDNGIVILRTLQDVQDMICEVLTEIKAREGLDESSGKINQLLQTWVKCFMSNVENTKLDSIEKRLEALESGQRTFIVPTAPEESSSQANGKQQKKEEATT